jgi:hypothetical protein
VTYAYIAQEGWLNRLPAEPGSTWVSLPEAALPQVLRSTRRSVAWLNAGDGRWSGPFVEADDRDPPDALERSVRGL